MKKAVVIIISLLLLKVAVAQQPDLVFHHLTQKDGLSYNIVNCFLKDSRGMLWIGTYNGLNRYDGAHFYVFNKQKNKNSIPNNTVHKLAEDREGNIWGATDNGIFCYNQKQNIFKNYRTPENNKWPVILNILCDKQGTIWACNQKSLVRFNAAADSFETATIKPVSNQAQTFVCRKNGLAISPDGKGLWLACREGLLYYNIGLQQLTNVNNSKDSSLFSGKSASALAATGFGHYWFFNNTDKKLVGFDPLAKKVKYTIQLKEFSTAWQVATIFEDDNHLVWVCTWGYELFTIDYLNGNKITKIAHSKSDKQSIAGDFFWAAMQEKDGTLWLGTVGGISRCNSNQSFYKVHQFSPDLFDSPIPVISYIAESKIDSAWWVVTSKSKLVQYNPVSAKINSYDFKTMPANKAGLKPEDVNRILFLKKQVLMFTNNGAWVQDGKKGFRAFTLPGFSDTVLIKDAATLNDSVIICTDYKTVWKWNTKSGKVNQLVYQQPFSIKGEAPLQMSLTAAGNNKVWMFNSYNWLTHADGEHLTAVKYATDDDDVGTGYYSRMAVDKNSGLWIAKKAVGLFYYNPATKKAVQYNQYDGLVMDHIMAVTVDNTGKIWTAAYNQFSVFNPQAGSFYNFTLPLSENKYAYVNQITTLANGNIICNVANQMVEFYPGKLKSYTVTSQPLISTYSVAGAEKLLPANNSISLGANENNILLKFGLLADNEASPFDMHYLMEGAETNWTVSGSNLEASYNNLAPGHYTFRVKAQAKDKSWQTRETVLQIKIATPFYKSWWFILLLTAVFVTGIYLLYRYRLNRQQQVMQLENKAQLLEKEKTTVMYESLKQQLNPHFLFNSLTSLSGLIESNQEVANEFLEQMSGIYRYILKSGDNETVLLRDEIKFVQQYISLQQTRFKSGLLVNINVPEEYLHCKIAPVTLQNLIENAIKHNIIDTESPLIVNIFIEDEYLVIKNNLQKKNVVETSNKKGLVQFAALYKYLSTKPVLIDETGTEFTIKIPLL